MLDDEVRQLLRELVQATHAHVASVVHAKLERPGDDEREVPLGHGAFLRLELRRSGARERALELGSTGTGFDAGPMVAVEQDDMVVAESMERCARALRACVRRWRATRVPRSTFSTALEPSEPPGERIRERIRTFLQALARSEGAELVLVTLNHRVVAASGPPDELQLERIPFIIRRVDVEAERRRTSHAELAGSDFYAASFWFDACLLVFFSGPFSPDFVRYRARMVTRELAPLLAMLDEPPPAPANVAPIPE